MKSCVAVPTSTPHTRRPHARTHTACPRSSSLYPPISASFQCSLHLSCMLASRAAVVGQRATMQRSVVATARRLRARNIAAPWRATTPAHSISARSIHVHSGAVYDAATAGDSNGLWPPPPGLPKFASIAASDVAPAVEAAVADFDAKLSALEQRVGQETWAKQDTVARAQVRGGW